MCGCRNDGKKKMGCPPNDPAEVRSLHINVRFEFAERDLLQTEVDGQGMTATDLLLDPWRDRKGE